MRTQAQIEKTENRLAQLYRRLTHYEIVATRDDQRILIGYSLSRSRFGMLQACRNQGEIVIAVLGLTTSDTMIAAPRAADGFTLGPWTIRFTGRTEREAILGGELPYIGEMLA